MWAIADDITQADDSIHILVSNVCHDRFKCGQIAVDVAQNGRTSHELFITVESVLFRPCWVS